MVQIKVTTDYKDTSVLRGILLGKLLNINSSLSFLSKNIGETRHRLSA